MQGGEKLSLEQIRAFLEASPEARFDGQSTAEVYAWVTRVLQQHGYNERTESCREGFVEVIHRESDRAEPCANHAADRPILGVLRSQK